METIKTQQTHTPTPWKVVNNTIIVRLEYDGKDTVIGDIKKEEDAEIIVRTVNSHEALLSIAKEVLEACERGGDLQLGPKGRNAGLEDRLKQAIAMVDGTK